MQTVWFSLYTSSPHDLCDRCWSNAALGSAIAGMLCLVCPLLLQSSIRTGRHKSWTLQTLIPKQLPEYTTALFEEHSCCKSIFRNRALPSSQPTHRVPPQVQRILVLVKDPTVQAPVSREKGTAPHLRSTVLHPSWAGTAWRVTKSTRPQGIATAAAQLEGNVCLHSAAPARSSMSQ